MMEQALPSNPVCVPSPNGWAHGDRHRSTVSQATQTLPAEADDRAPAEFSHAMLRPIYGQPAALANALRGRLDEADAQFRDLTFDPKRLRQADRIIMTGCGTSYHAALVGEYLFEELARIPVEVEHAADFPDRNAPIGTDTIVLALSASGETADTLAALRECKRKGHPTLAVCDGTDNPIAREADGGIDVRAGPEVAAAPVNAFPNQVALLAALALYFGRMGYLSHRQAAGVARELRAVPELVRQALACHNQVRAVAAKYARNPNFLFLGRHYLYPVALEGARLLRELTPLSAEGYAAVEAGDGSPGRADRATPAVFLTPRGAVYPKAVRNLDALKARGGPVIAIAAAADAEVAARADDLIIVPEAPEYLQPLVSVVALQLLAYHVALLPGGDLAQPGNGTGHVAVA